MAGPSQPVVALITSSSLAEAADRLQYASALAQQDADSPPVSPFSRRSSRGNRVSWPARSRSAPPP